MAVSIKLEVPDALILVGLWNLPAEGGARWVKRIKESSGSELYTNANVVFPESRRPRVKAALLPLLPSRIFSNRSYSVDHVHEDCGDRRDEGHDRGRQTQPSDPAAGCQRLLHPCNTFFKRLADCCCVHAGRFLEQ